MALVGKREMAAKVASARGIRALARSMMPWSGVLVLNYHRVGDGSASRFDRGLWSATEGAFEAQIRLLKRGFDVIAPSDLEAVVHARRGRYVMVTFDDGYRDNFEIAYTILRANGVPATFFITTGFIDHRRLPWWDEIAWMARQSEIEALPPSKWLNESVQLRSDVEGGIRALLGVYKSLPADSATEYLDWLGQATGSGRFDASSGGEDPWMTWDMIREMHRAGMSIGGHTVDHPILAKCSQERQEFEISESLSRLAKELGERATSFSYPVGNRDSFDAFTRACLRANGVSHAFSFYGGFRRYEDWDDLDIRRSSVEANTSMELFQATISLPQIFS